jgi:hypothetical protein
MGIGAAANTAVGAVAYRRAGDLSSWLRATGNGTFVAYAAPFVVRAGRTGRGEWWLYVGSHIPHLTGLVLAAARHRRGSGSFSAASRYGGLGGYVTLAALGATAYAPAGPPPGRPVARASHRAGEHVLFGLYAFTIAHGYRAKGRNLRAYGPLAALWSGAALRGRARWNRPPRAHAA